MSNYYENLASNKFKVRTTEKGRLEKIFKNLMGEDVHTEISTTGEDIFGWFGGYGGISGLDVENYFEDNEELALKYSNDEYTAMIEELQKCLNEDGYITLMEAGYEDLSDIGGGVLVITADKYEFVSLYEVAENKVKELLSEA